jgi:hypothetical protein
MTVGEPTGFTGPVASDEVVELEAVFELAVRVAFGWLGGAETDGAAAQPEPRMRTAANTAADLISFTAVPPYPFLP